jgi:hypothetical protein
MPEVARDADGGRGACPSSIVLGHDLRAVGLRANGQGLPAVPEEGVGPSPPWLTRPNVTSWPRRSTPDVVT